jgi:hypothetical protein
MRKLLSILCLLASCAREEPPPAPEGPVAWSVTASADKKEVQVGEDLTLTLVVRHPPEGRFVAPPDAAFAPFDVIERTEEKPGPTESRLRFRLAAYRLPGDVQIPALQVPYQESGKTDSLSTEAIPVAIVTSLTPDVTDIHDIKDPVDLMVPRDFRLLAWLLLALLAALIAYLIYRKLRKEPGRIEAPIPPPPLPPPDVEAEAALRRLAEKRLPEKREFAAFYTELAEIVKRYVGRRFDIPYLERTTSEMIFDLRPKKLASSTISELRGILDASDLVKFARYLPEQAHAEETLAMAHSWIRTTRPEPAPEKAIA